MLGNRGVDASYRADATRRALECPGSYGTRPDACNDLAVLLDRLGLAPEDGETAVHAEAWLAAVGSERWGRQAWKRCAGTGATGRSGPAAVVVPRNRGAPRTWGIEQEHHRRHFTGTWGVLPAVAESFSVRMWGRRPGSRRPVSGHGA